MEVPVLTVLTDAHTTLVQTVLLPASTRAQPREEGRVSEWFKDSSECRESSKCSATTNTDPRPPLRPPHRHLHYTTTYTEAHCIRPSYGHAERVSRRRTRYTLKSSACESDEFARSLRRYPPSPAPSPRTPSPRSPSREVLQRLVDYTTRNNNKSLDSTKCNVSARDPGGVRVKCCRGTQTYTRTYTDAHSYSNGDVTNNRPKQNKKNQRRWWWRGGAEVRRLEEVSRCVRDVLRNMYCQEHEFCPKIRSRYEHHRRHHHNNGRESSTTQNNNTNTCQGANKVTEVTTSTQSDAQMAGASRPKSSRICCHCKKPHPCACRAALPHRDLVEHVRDHVTTWTQHIPVPADDTHTHKQKRTQLATQLADELVRVIRTNNTENIRPVVERYLQLMPMWTPGDENVKKLFLNEIVEALCVHIDELAHKDTIRDDVIKCLKQLPLSGNSIDGGVVDNIMKIIQNTKDMDNKWNLKRDIEDVLRKLPLTADVDKDEAISNVADNLLNNLYNKQRPSSLGTNTPLVNKITNNSNDSFTKLIEGFPKSLQDLLSKDSYDDDELEAAREQITKYLDSLLDSIDVRLHTRTKNKLADRFINKIRRGSRRNSNDSTIEEEESRQDETTFNEADTIRLRKLTRSSLKKRITDDVIDVLDTSDISTRRSTLEANLTEMLADQVVRGVRTSQAAREIHSMLVNCDVPEQQAQQITVDLLNRTKNMSQIDEDDSETERSNHPRASSPEVQNTINGVLTSTNQTEQSERKRSGDAGSPTVSTTAPPETRQYETPRKVRRLSFQASSPQQDKRTSRQSFGNLSSIQTDDQLNRNDNSKNEILASEQKYTKELHDVLETWINELPLNLDVSGGQDYKKTLIHDLVGDIVDRNKYLALSKKAKSSDEEEVDHLRYQVFRWLNKLVDTHELSKIMPNTDQLMTQLRDITVPLFKQASGSRTIAKREQGEIPHYNDALEDEISVWMDDIASNFIKSRNKLSQEDMVKDLANKIKQSNESNIDSEIEAWLRDAARQSDAGNIEKTKKSLKLMLERKGFGNKSHIVQQDTAEFIEENLSGAILEWLRVRPICSRNKQDQLQQEQVASELARAITRGYTHTDTDDTGLDPTEYFMKQIQEHLKRLPLDAKNKGNEEFIAKISKELLSHLQGLRMFQDVSNRVTEDQLTSDKPGTEKEQLKDAPTIEDNDVVEEETTQDSYIDETEGIMNEQSSINKRMIRKPADILNDSIAKTCKNIGGSVSPEIKQEIANRVISRVEDLNTNPEIFNDDVLYSALLTEEVDDVLKNLQVTESLSSFKRNVIEKINTARNKTMKSKSGQTYRQNLKQAINSSLPPIEAMSGDERALFEIVKDDLVDAFVNDNYSSGNEQLKGKYKNKVDKKVTEFCDNYLKRFPATPIDRKKLNEGLTNALKSVPLPETDALRSEAEQSMIKEQLRQMITELPLEQETAEQKLRTNKIINVLAKNVQEIESHKPYLTESETDGIMKEEVAKWLKKLPMKSDAGDGIVQEFTNKVVDKLKASEQSRQAPVVTDVSTDDEWTDVSSSLQPTRRPGTAPRSNLATSLTDKDRAHLQRIRERTQLKPQQSSPTAGSQTGLEPQSSAAVDTEGLSETKMDQVLTERDSQTSDESKELVDQATEAPRLSQEHRESSTDADVGRDVKDPCVPRCGQCEWSAMPACSRPRRGCAVVGGAERGVVGGIVEGIAGGYCEGTRRRVLRSAAVGGRPALHRCPKCCGAPCPHPSYLYFK